MVGRVRHRDGTDGWTDSGTTKTPLGARQKECVPIPVHSQVFTDIISTESSTPSHTDPPSRSMGFQVYFGSNTRLTWVTLDCRYGE